MYLQKVISRKTIFNLVFWWVLKVNDENSRIRIRIRIRIHEKETWIRESGSKPKDHESGTLLMQPNFPHFGNIAPSFGSGGTRFSYDMCYAGKKLFQNL